MNFFRGSRCLRAPLCALSRTQTRFAAGFIAQVPGRRLQSTKARALTAGFQIPAVLTACVALGGFLFWAPGRSDQKEDCTCENYTEKVGRSSGSTHASPVTVVSSQAGPTEPVSEASLETSTLPVEEAVLSSAPNVPPAITRNHPVLLRVQLVATPHMAQLTSAYKYEQWTFNKTVPGPFIRAREGDVVELTLTNRDPAGNPHNVDCHAFSGPGGGAAVTTAPPTESRTARFKLLAPGLFLYHCAAAPVPVHIAMGMYGLLYVQPAAGDVGPVPDREYYVMQSEFYHEPPEVDDDTGRRSDVVEFSYPNALREEPSVVVFNGSESALTRDHPLQAHAGERVRLFFGNAGPNCASALHVIGTLFQRVCRDGDVLSPPARNLQTVAVPPGSAAVLDLEPLVPGTYTLVDHAMFRLDKGAVGFLNVAGAPRPDLYQSAQAPAPCTGCKLHS